MQYTSVNILRVLLVQSNQLQLYEMLISNLLSLSIALCASSSSFFVIFFFITEFNVAFLVYK